MSIMLATDETGFHELISLFFEGLRQQASGEVDVKVNGEGGERFKLAIGKSRPSLLLIKTQYLV